MNPDLQEKTIWSFLRKEVWIIGTAICCTIFFYNQISDLKINQAVMNQKLDTLISWTKQHEQETATMRQELNLTFSDIYLKLGSKYISKQ